MSRSVMVKIEVPPLSIKERDGQKAVKAVVQQLLAARESLADLHARFAKVRSDGAMAAGLIPSSVAFMLRTAIECQLHDRLDPLIRDLTAASELTPLDLVREWEGQGGRKREE